MTVFAPFFIFSFCPTHINNEFFPLLGARRSNWPPETNTATVRPWLRVPAKRYRRGLNWDHKTHLRRYSNRSNSDKSSWGAGSTRETEFRLLPAPPIQVLHSPVLWIRLKYVCEPRPSGKLPHLLRHRRRLQQPPPLNRDRLFSNHERDVSSRAKISGNCF